MIHYGRCGTENCSQLLLGKEGGPISGVAEKSPRDNCNMDGAQHDNRD